MKNEFEKEIKLIGNVYRNNFGVHLKVDSVDVYGRLQYYIYNSDSDYKAGNIADCRAMYLSGFKNLKYNGFKLVK